MPNRSKYPSEGTRLSNLSAADGLDPAMTVKWFGAALESVGLHRLPRRTWGRTVKLFEFSLCILLTVVIGSAKASDAEPLALPHIPAEVMFVHCSKQQANGLASVAAVVPGDRAQVLSNMRISEHDRNCKDNL